ncbi:MAG: hypothetical protein M1422_06290 [Candidatus Thermoplasmatota archaeon]|nr:hypothetical protein [Candidatus Thermoplasmatota archaeon]
MLQKGHDIDSLLTVIPSAPLSQAFSMSFRSEESSRSDRAFTVRCRIPMHSAEADASPILGV